MTEMQESAELKNQVLALVADRLSSGEVLISEAQFQQAMEEGYAELKNSEVREQEKSWLRGILTEVNSQNPEVFVVPGMENWIVQSVLANARKQGWGVVEIQEQGNQAIRMFLRDDKVQGVLAKLNVNASQLNQKRCFRSILNTIAGKPDPDQQRAAERLAQLKKQAAARSAAPAIKEGVVPAKAGPGLDELLSGPAEMPSEEESEARIKEQKRERAEMRKSQMAQLVTHLDAYVQQGKLSAEDAERLRKAHKVDEAVRTGKVTQEKGSKIRNSILDGTARDKVEKQVKDAVDYAVVYTQVFQALGRMDPKYDDGLRFLAQHKYGVNADKKEGEEALPEVGRMVAALMEDIDILRHVIDLMDRQDSEVRMIAAHLPPYSYIMRRDQARIENMVVEEEFVDELRGLSSEELSTRFHSADKKVRAKVAADLLCMTSLISRLIKPTPIRKEIRLLKLNLIVEEFYRATDNMDEARTRAQEFLRTRLKSVYPDMSDEEKVEIEKCGAEIIEAVEQKILTERQEAAAAKGEKSGDGKVAASAGGEAAGDSTLSADEEAKGVQIHRISMRVAGRERHVPQKIMPDVEDPSKFILVQRDPDTKEMVPVRRRGAKRYVHRGRDGSWQLE